MKAAISLPYVIAGVKGLQLAVSAEYVQEIVRTPRWHVVPNTPRHIRGVINLRGKVLPLVDLRVRLGLPSALEDVEQMIAMLSAREQDHIFWQAAFATGSVKSDLLTKVANRANDKGIVFLLDAEALLAGHGDTPPAPGSTS